MRPVICRLNFSLEACENLITPFHRREMMKGAGVGGEVSKRIIWKGFSSSSRKIEKLSGKISVSLPFVGAYVNSVVYTVAIIQIIFSTLIIGVYHCVFLLPPPPTAKPLSISTPLYLQNDTFLLMFIYIWN